MSKSTSAVTRPLVKVFLDMVDTSLKFLVPFFFFLLHETLYTVRIIRSMLSLKSSRNQTFKIMFSFVSRNFARILIAIPSIVANS